MLQGQGPRPTGALTGASVACG